MWFTANQNVTLTVDFLVDGDFVMPDTATITLRDNAGAVIAGWDHIDLTPSGYTSTTVIIPAADNQIAVEKMYESRFAVIDFTVQGTAHQRMISFKLMDFVPMTATPADVRREFGLDESELPDADVDLPSAYFQLTNRFPLVFPAALTLGTHLTLSANLAIVLQAALNLVPSLMFRAGKSFKSEESQFQRNNADFEALRRDLSNRLATELATLTETSSVAVSSLVLSNPTDPVTGA